MKARPGPLDLAAPACLAAAGAIEGLLLASGPVLHDYSAVRLGPRGIFVSLPWLCVLGLGALGAIAGLARWLRTLFLTLLAVPVSWSLARSSQHPWWLLHATSPWRVQAPSAAALAGHALAVALVCAAALLDALGRSRAAMAAQGMAPEEVRRDTGRLGLRGLGIAGLCLLLAFLLPGILDPLAATLRGAIKGPAAFALLLASSALLLLGLALLASPGRGRRKARSG
jgi:hypothetical protein